MTRVRTDNVFGTTTDNPLTNVATTMNSAGLANLAAVSSAEAIIVIDPNRLTGAPEIVVVTAHTGAATSATIQRGQFGTSARQHAAGTEWVHGPIASNATSLVTAADDQGDYPPANAWEAWTPTLANLTLGSGTLTAHFTRIGRTIHYRFVFIYGAGSAVGTNPTFTLPVTASSAYATQSLIGDLALLDSGTAVWRGTVRASSTTIGRLDYYATTALQTSITAATPFVWTTSDALMATGTYEAST